MIFFALAGFAALFALVWAAADDESDWGEAVLFAAFTGVAGMIVALILAMTVGTAVYDAEPYSYTFDVMAAKDGSSVQGQFGIFGGTIDEEQYYFFYRRYADGRIEQGKIRADDTVIYQDQETLSFIKVIKADTTLEAWGMRWGYGPDYEIHVPDGAVIEGAEFDLE